MPNRMLRDWTDSEKVNRISAEAERLFTRLIMKVDDYGGYFADARRLRPSLFPFLLEQISEKDVERWVRECEKSGLIKVFTYEGKQYLQILDFKQRLDKSRAKYPFPPENIDSQQPVDETTISGNSLTKSTEFPAEVEEEKKLKREKKTPPKGGDGADAPPDDIEQEYSKLEKSKRLICDFIKEKQPTFIQPFVDLWNIFAQEKSLPKVTKLSNSRKRKFKVRLSEKGFDFLEILKKASKSEFLLTGNWFGFDWIFQNDSNFLKILEGKYDSKTPEQIAAVKRTIPAPAPVVPINTERNNLDFLFGMYQEGKLEDRMIPDELYDKLVTRYGLPAGTIDRMKGETLIDKKRAGVREYFRLQTINVKEASV
jgi:hypothetical protein